MPEKIKVQNLTKIYGKNVPETLKKLKAGVPKDEIPQATGDTVGIYDVSFDVKEGETFVIMGLSGSGKSTLIRCLNLLNSPTEGQIFINGEDIVKYDKKQLKELRQNKLAMVFQHFGLFTHMTVMDNVEYGLSIREIDEKKRKDIAGKAIETVGLGGWENKYPNQLSGGMQQRVGLARALANDPEILLMDEPFSALDPLIRRDMQEELMEIQARIQKTIVFITHDVNEAFKIGDRVAVMKDAQIEQIGRPEEILDAPASDYIEAFVKDIDKTKVIQAKNIMIKTHALAYLNSGPKMAVREMQANGISSVFVVDREKKLQGIVTIDDAIVAGREQKTLKDILRHDYLTLDPDSYIQDMIPKATESKYPLAVVDENNKLLGIVVRVSVLSGLM